MVDPMLSSVFDKRNVTDIILFDAVVQPEKNAQAGLGDNRVCRLKKDVIAGDTLA
jgi:hypothetical protein